MELKERHGMPFIHSSVHQTEKGTPYLTEPGVVMVVKPHVEIRNLDEFLSGFDETLGFADYLNDHTPLPPAEEAVMVAGQTCYASFGSKRTKKADVAKYLENIKSSGHGSVMEHPNFSFIIYGVSRSFSHELVRHRAGFSYSQLSQRYVSGKILRFVEKKSFQQDPKLHQQFVESIDRAVEEYEKAVERLLQLQKSGLEILSAEGKTDLRKKVQQDAREFLPNSTETFFFLTANVRAWRHFCEMRANEHAETQIREVAYRVFLCLRHIAPFLFNDYEEKKLDDATMAIATPYRKV